MVQKKRRGIVSVSWYYYEIRRRVKGKARKTND